MKKRNYTKYIVALMAVVCMVSCRKDGEELMDPDQHYCRTYTEQFKIIWSGINESYVFWERESKDWDSVYDALLPVFEDFDAKGRATYEQLKEAYESMVEGLLDHHMYVQVKNVKSGDTVYAIPASKEVQSRDYYHYDYTYQQAALLKNMEGVTNYKEGGYYLPCWFAMFPGSGGKKIAYLRFYSFDVNGLADMIRRGSLDNEAAAPFRSFYGTDFINGVTNGWAGNDNVEAVIIDVRGNGGGNLTDIPSVVGSLTPTRVDYGYSRVKEGLGRLDYSAWTPFYVDSHPNHINTDKKVVVLADVHSASCAELTAYLVQQMPHGTFIGERTWGATCPLLPGGHDMLYCGVFGDFDKYGYYVYTSNFDMVTKEYRSLEGVGTTPDIECIFDYNALQNGHDNQLERALQFIRSGK